MDLMTILESFGLPVAMLFAFGWWIFYQDKKKSAEDNARIERETDERKERELREQENLNKLHTALDKANDTSRELLEANHTIVNTLSNKVDNVDKKMDVVLESIEAKLDILVNRSEK